MQQFKIVFILHKRPRITGQRGRFEFRVRQEFFDDVPQQHAGLIRRPGIITFEDLAAAVGDFALEGQERRIGFFLRRRIPVGVNAVPVVVVIRLDAPDRRFAAFRRPDFRAQRIHGQREFRQVAGAFFFRQIVERIMRRRSDIFHRPGVDHKAFPFRIQTGIRGRDHGSAFGQMSLDPAGDFLVETDIVREDQQIIAVPA